MKVFQITILMWINTIIFGILFFILKWILFVFEICFLLLPLNKIMIAIIYFLYFAILPYIIALIFKNVII